MSNSSRIAHPDWIDDACGRLANTLHLDSTMPHGLPTRAFMLSTPAHRMLRAIFGGTWAVCWWAFKKAMASSVDRALPLWWHKLAYRVKYGESIDADAPKCDRCNDTGVIETGNNDLPCGCSAGASAVFNDAEFGRVTGAELHRLRRIEADQ